MYVPYTSFGNQEVGTNISYDAAAPLARDANLSLLYSTEGGGRPLVTRCTGFKHLSGYFSLQIDGLAHDIELF